MSARGQTPGSNPDTLAMLGVLDAVLADDSANEPPDFVVPDDDLGSDEPAAPPFRLPMREGTER